MDSNRQQRERDKFTATNDFTSVRTVDSSTFYFEVARGEVPGWGLRAVVANKVATTTEGVVSEGLTGRYPFPATPAQMSIVSTSANDTLGGTGTNVILVRGLTVSGTDWIETNEAVIMNGTTPVITSNSFIRVNSMYSAVVGSGGVNAGTITMTNGADTLHSMIIGENITRTGIWSSPTNKNTYLHSTVLTASYSVSSEAIFGIYLKCSALGLPMLKIFELSAFRGTIPFNFKVPYLILPQCDLEITVVSNQSTVNTSCAFELTEELI